MWPATIPYPTKPDPIKIDEIIRRQMKEDQPVTRKEFDELKRQVEQMKTELETARAEDIANGEPDCEMEDKVELLKRIAGALGLDLEGVFPNDYNKTTKEQADLPE
jgi:uncharacterized protein YlxW (UPF0749 family)